MVPDSDTTVAEDYHRARGGDGHDEGVDDRAVRERVMQDEDVRRRILQEEMEKHGLIRPRVLSNPAATAGLTLGIAAVAVGWVPALFPFAALFGLFGLFLSMTGRARAADHERTGGARAVAGIVVSLIGVALAVIGFLIVADVVNTFDGTISDGYDRIRDAADNLKDTFS